MEQDVSPHPKETAPEGLGREGSPWLNDSYPNMLRWKTSFWQKVFGIATCVLRHITFLKSHSFQVPSTMLWVSSIQIGRGGVFFSDFLQLTFIRLLLAWFPMETRLCNNIIESVCPLLVIFALSSPASTECDWEDRNLKDSYALINVESSSCWIEERPGSEH